MELRDVLAMVEDQDRGRWFDLLHPVTGAPVGIRLLVAGPDSRRQAEALALLTDELAEAAGPDGRVSGKDRAECHRRLVARCVLDWVCHEDGAPLPFSFDRCRRLLSVAWVQSQADAFAAARSVWFEGGADAAA